MARILVIEDNEPNMRLATIILESGGHEVLAAFDATSGLAIARTGQPDLVLMDIQLPGLDGQAAMEQLRQDPKTALLPVLALTAFAMKGDQERFLTMGFDGYLAKPYRGADLLRVVEENLARRGVAT